MTREITIKLGVVGGAEAAAQIGNVNAELANTKPAAASASDGFSNLTGGLAALATGFIGVKGLELASSILSDGEAALRTTALFNGLASGAGYTADLMNQLQSATGGATTNLDIMSGTSRLMTLGLADNQTDLVNIVQTADFLGDALGRDGDVLGDFANMLTTHSTRALKGWGLSAEAVTESMKGFKESFPNASEQDLFKMAVLDEATKHTKDFADAAALADDPLSKFETRVTNIADGFKMWAASGLNTLATTVDKMGTLFNFAMSRDVDTQMGASRFYVSPEEMAAQAAAANAAPGSDAYEIQRLNAQRQRFEQELADAQAAAESHRGAMLAGAKSNRPSSFDVLTLIGFGDQATRQAADQVLRDEAEQRAVMLYAAQQSFSGGMSGEQSFLTSHTVGKFLDPSEVQTYTDELAKAESYVVNMKSLFEAGLIADTDLTAAEAMRDQIKGLADDAGRAVDAFANMKMPDFTGQTSGGLAGDIEAQVLAAMKDAHRSKADIASAESSLDLATGKETQTSLALADTLKTLATTLSPADMSKAVQNLQSFIQLSTSEGWTDQQKATALAGASGFEGKSAVAGFDPNVYAQSQMLAFGGAGGAKTMSDQPFTKDAKGNIVYTDPRAAGGGVMGNEALVRSTKDISDNMGEAKTRTLAFQQAMASIPAVKTTKVIVSLTADDPDGVLALIGLNPSMLAQLTASTPGTGAAPVGTMSSGGNRLN